LREKKAICKLQRLPTQIFEFLCWQA